MRSLPLFVTYASPCVDRDSARVRELTGPVPYEPQRALYG